MTNLSLSVTFLLGWCCAFLISVEGLSSLATSRRFLLTRFASTDDENSSTKALHLGVPVPETDQLSETFDWTKQWYPVLPLSSLYDDKNLIMSKPLGITILDQDLVVWKTADGDDFSILDDSCPHRLAPLSEGKVFNNTLACRYHGWEFSKEGSCTNIPMMPKNNKEEKLSKAFCVKSYPAQVHDGLLWVYMDASEASPPLIPGSTGSQASNNNLQDDKPFWLATTNPISWQSMIENSFDPSHAPFTHESHGRSFGFYAPSMAIPMSKFEFVFDKESGKKAGVHKQGFTLQHTPYQLPPNAPAGAADQALTTRQFVALATTMTRSAFLNTSLHFSPYDQEKLLGPLPSLKWPKHRHPNGNSSQNDFPT
jgi:phenylpropionate dioxygenase-like ring-hydroxylating dioxygenase large terminal subunit